MDWNKAESLLAVKNDSPLIAIAAPPPPPSFEFRGPNNEPMVTIRPTGEVELAPGLEISEASRLFWQGLVDAFPAWRAEVIAAALAERKPDRIWQDRNGALRTSPADCQSFGADGWPIAVYYGSQRFPISQHPLTEEDEP